MLWLLSIRSSSRFCGKSWGKKKKRRANIAGEMGRVWGDVCPLSWGICNAAEFSPSAFHPAHFLSVPHSRCQTFLLLSSLSGCWDLVAYTFGTQYLNESKPREKGC